MVAGADGDALFVKDLAEVKGMDLADEEGDDPCPMFSVGIPDEAETFYFLEGIEGVGHETMFGLPDIPDPEVLEIVDGRGQSDGAGDIGCSRFKFIGEIVVGGLFKGHCLDHLAATLVRG